MPRVRQLASNLTVKPMSFPLLSFCNSAVYRNTRLERMIEFRLPIRRLSFMSLLIGAIFGCFLNSFVLQSLQQSFFDTPEIGLPYENETLTETFIEFNENPTVETREVKDEGVTKDPVDLYEKVRVLCWIMTSPENHETKALAVKETWGKRCNVILFMSSEKDSKLPSVQLPVKEGRARLWGKTRESFHYAWDRYQDEVDWFLKADDDTYIIVENLRYFLSAFNTSEPMWFGHKYKTNVTAGFHSGGAGYVLSKEATRRFVQEGYDNSSICRYDHEGAEDVEMGRCMESLKVLTMDTRDSKGRGRFFPFQPDRFYFSRKITNYWYWKFVYYPPLMGPDCCSDSTISFHYIDPKTMHLLDFFLYKIRPYGIVDHRPATPEPPPDLELTATPWFAPNETTNVGGIPMITQKRNAEDSRVNTEENVIEEQEATDQQSPPDYNKYQVHSAEMIDQQTSTLKPLPDSNLTTNSRFISREIESEISNVPVIQSTRSQLNLRENDTISNATKRSKMPIERKTFHRNITKMNAPTEPVAEKEITSKSPIVIPNVSVANQKNSVDIPINNKRKAYRKKEPIDFQKLYLEEKVRLTDL